MIIGPHDAERHVVVIAEIGNNHEGDLEVALEMVREAAAAGADVVKFQTIVPDRLVSADQRDRIAQLGRFQFSRKQFEKLAAEANEVGVLFMSTPFDLDSVEWLDALVPAFKIASGDNDFFALHDRIAATGKPVLVSLGFGGEARAGAIVDFFDDAWARHGTASGGVALLHCVASYPTPPDRADLGAIQRLSRIAPTVGYSDHTLGLKAAELAVAAGARIVEKHFTLDKSRDTFRDHQLSADPADLRDLVDAIRRTEMMFARPLEDAGAAELGARRSLAAARDLSEGGVLQADDITWVRPGTGIRPGEEGTVIGRRLRRAVPAGNLIQTDDLA